MAQLSKKSLYMVLTLLLVFLFVPLSAVYAANELTVVSVWATSDDGNVPANTLDNNYSTRWSAQGDGQSITYDLGSQYNVEYVKIAWHQGNTRTAYFEIQVSSNNSSWTTVYNGSSSGTTTSLETYNFSDTAARYVRIVGHENSYNNWNSITETEIWGSAVSGGGGKLAISSATVSTYDTRCDCNAPNAIDGDLNTRWSGQGDGAWIKFDLGSSKTVGSIKIAFHQGNQRTSSFDIQTSTDNSSWTTTYSGTSSGTTLQLESFNFADVTARYIRYVGHGNTSNDWNSLTEVEIYGADGTGDGGGGSGGGSGLDPSKPPSGNFDLTKWKITLPDASEVQPSALSSGYQHPNWFFTDPNTGGMVFRSPNLGDTTQNSSYTRSELREMLNPSVGTQALGNNWVTSTSSSSTKQQAGGVDGTMNATLRVDHVSTTGDSGKVGRVIVGQIHGPDTEPIRLYYHKRPSDSKGAIYFGTDDLNNNNTWVNVIGGPNNLNPSNGIALGQTWSYEIKVAGLQMTVKVTPEGGTTTTVTYTLPSGYNNKYLYFKAGVYNQNNTGTSSDYAQATFFSLTHTHP